MAGREKTALAAGFALGVGSYALWRRFRKANEPSLRCPATEWPAGAPLRTTEYPPYDLSDKKGAFLKVCDRLIDEIHAELPMMYSLPPRELKWVRDMLEYNTKGGKMNRGLMVVECGIILYEAKGLELTDTVLNQFAVLGWCIEWLQAWLLVADDVMDSSLTRRGQPCWYKRPDVGHIAINDAFLIEMLVFKILKRHFGEHKKCVAPRRAPSLSRLARAVRDTVPPLASVNTLARAATCSCSTSSWRRRCRPSAASCSTCCARTSS